MLPYTRRSFAGYRLMKEYFCFPQKFFFFDLGGLDRLRAAGFQRTGGNHLSDLAVRARRAARDAGDRHLRQNFPHGLRSGDQSVSRTPPNRSCSTSKRYEYQVIPDVSRRNAMEVFSIDDVVSVDPRLGRGLSL